jgi:L-gulono-1,4-lactone dehydrogenase
MRIENFGRNVRFVPRVHQAPRSEDEVLEILDRHADGRVRALGSLHSWSDVPVSEDVALDLRRLDSVDVAAGEEGGLAVEVGGGCRLKRLLDLLRLEAGAMLPTLGAVTAQTVAGAVATATHGSGATSLSHLVQKVRAAAYDPGTGRAEVYEWSDGPGLRAARCALGCLGVVLSLRLPAVPRFFLEEDMVRRDTVEEVLAGVAEYPQQLVVWLPWDWRFYPYRRRVVPGPPEGGGRARAYARRGANWLGVDVGLHLVLEGLVRWGSPESIRGFFRGALPSALLLDRPVVDDARHILTLHHDYFRHVEMELFVPESRLPEALAVVREVLTVLAGEAERPSDAVAARAARG